MVAVEGGKFVVRAYNNMASNDTERHVLHWTFDPKGDLIQKSRKIEPPRRHIPYEEYSFMDRLPKEDNGLERKWGDKILIIPESLRKHGGRPFIIEYDRKAFKYHQLHWRNPEVSQVVDACIADDRLYLLVTRSGLDDETGLSLYRFSLKTFSEEASVELPRPYLIWSSPVCSNLIEYRGKVYLGVVTHRLLGFRLVLAGWDGMAPHFSGQTLTTRIDWNTTLSLAHIGRNAFIAYHYPGDHWGWFPFINPPDASIKTIPFELK